jgi:hypothetical protein
MLHLPAPSERFVADAQIAPGGTLGEFMELADARSSSAMTADDVFEHTSANGAPIACMTSNLRSARSRFCR